ncbi:hypothetical protein A2Y99_02145, partial [Candidatus Gottesmanbacteria bacterium RBG_13_37_7]
LFGTLIVGIYLILRSRKVYFPKGQIGQIFFLGLLNTLLALLAFYAFANTSIAISEVLLYVYPIYIVILAPLILKEKTNNTIIINLLAAFLGIILIAFSANYSYKSDTFWGIIASFFAGIIFALYVVYGKLIGKNISAIELSLYQLIVSVILLFPFALYYGAQITVFQMKLLILMGLFHSAIAVSLYFYGLKSIKAQHVGALSYIEPLSAVVYALFIFGEIPNIFTVIGGLLIIIGGYRVTKK